MKSKLMLAAATATVAMASMPVSAQSKIERTYNNPTAIIAGTVSIPAGARTVYLSGSTASPIDAAKPDEFGDTKTQTLSILTKMKATLATLGLTMADVVKVNVFLVGVPENGGKMDAPGMNEVFKTFFGSADQPNRPARSTVQVAALGRPTTLVEIEAIAAKAP
jgi:enamine deaminase RidA (YjgF/YER057c/UK114 family)